MLILSGTVITEPLVNTTFKLKLTIVATGTLKLYVTVVVIVIDPSTITALNNVFNVAGGDDLVGVTVAVGVGVVVLVGVTVGVTV